MKMAIGTLTMATLFLFTVSALAADKVVVIPLGKKPTGDAVAADVMEGKTFSNKDEIGIPGTMADFSDSSAKVYTPGASVVNIDTGYHDGSTVATDAKLLPENIKSSVSIFGVSGAVNVVDTSSGDAVSIDIIRGKSAWVKGVLVEGVYDKPQCQVIDFCHGVPGDCSLNRDECALEFRYDSWDLMTSACNSATYPAILTCVRSLGECDGLAWACQNFKERVN